MTSNKLSIILIIMLTIIGAFIYSSRDEGLVYPDFSITDKGDTLIIHRGLSKLNDLMLINKRSNWYLVKDTSRVKVDGIEIIRNGLRIKSIRFSVGENAYKYE